MEAVRCSAWFGPELGRDAGDCPMAYLPYGRPYRFFAPPCWMMPSHRLGGVRERLQGREISTRSPSTTARFGRAWPSPGDPLPTRYRRLCAASLQKAGGRVEGDRGRSPL